MLKIKIMRNIQATGSLYGKMQTLKQISKGKAFKLFSKGEIIYLQSSNMHPFNIWQSICPISLDKDRMEYSIEFNKKWPDSKIDDEITQFNEIINSYKWYNCDSERGYYINFYQTI